MSARERERGGGKKKIKRIRAVDEGARRKQMLQVAFSNAHRDRCSLVLITYRGQLAWLLYWDQSQFHWWFDTGMMQNQSEWPRSQRASHFEIHACEDSKWQAWSQTADFFQILWRVNRGVREKHITKYTREDERGGGGGKEKIYSSAVKSACSDRDKIVTAAAASTGADDNEMARKKGLKKDG